MGGCRPPLAASNCAKCNVVQIAEQRGRQMKDSMIGVEDVEIELPELVRDECRDLVVQIPRGDNSER